ncbi:S53 family peptidase [Ktedonobacter racemifer]|uniref:Peptidase S53 propeptide n=1 Tax=Ktedonobacter racemifer DSM 44963 TaxID=485913 RepID=D6TL96_KTERA|nr:S53 family peptidase [Ktedonobacter racemifer]EFH86546.1 Peptidase S53 propeptide [Ktedonobacter racemifer DSM 44963]
MTTRNRASLSALLLLITVLLGALVSACTADNSGGNTSTTNTSPGGAPRKAPTRKPGPLANQPLEAQAALLGSPLSPGSQLTLTFNLAFDDDALNAFVTQLYTPGSASFHQFLTPEQLVQRFAMPDAQTKQIQAWLTQQGYTQISTDPLHSSIKAQATVQTIQTSLGTQLYTFSLLNQQFYMQNKDPHLPSSIESYIQTIAGLNNLALPDIKPPRQSTHIQQLGQESDCTKYGAKQTLTQQKLAAAYQVDQLYKKDLQGQGTTIGIAEFGDPYDINDVQNYIACTGQSMPSIQNIDVGTPLPPGTGEGEATMDVELIAGLAPKASILVYQTQLQDANNPISQVTSFAQGMLDVFNRVASDHKVQVLSVSYGLGEEMFSTSDQIAINNSLRNLAAEGISVFISSGDCGAYSLRARFPQIAEVSFPGSAPYAISVGGTYLQVGDDLQRSSETVWGGDDGTPVCQNSWGSGGGVSQNSAFTRPGWQAGDGVTTSYNGTTQGVFVRTLPPQTLQAPNGLRQVPDIAAAAYPNISIYYDSAWVRSGGTSAAAPIAAAGTALVDQGLRQSGKSPLGGIPEFYRLANKAGSNQPYTDITQGDNLFYPATKGWDYTTGWGSPNFATILSMES